MYMFVDSINGNDVNGFVPPGTDTEKLILVEIELFDDKSMLDNPLLGIEKALLFAKKMQPIIIFGNKEYSEIPDWDDLVRRENVYFCLKPIKEECFVAGLKKLEIMLQ